MAKGVCIFCRNVWGLRQRTRLLVKHPIWVSGHWLTCPGTGCYAKPIEEPETVGAVGQRDEAPHLSTRV